MICGAAAAVFALMIMPAMIEKTAEYIYMTRPRTLMPDPYLEGPVIVRKKQDPEVL